MSGRLNTHAHKHIYLLIMIMSTKIWGKGSEVGLILKLPCTYFTLSEFVLYACITLSIKITVLENKTKQGIHFKKKHHYLIFIRAFIHLNTSSVLVRSWDLIIQPSRNCEPITTMWQASSLPKFVLGWREKEKGGDVPWASAVFLLLRQPLCLPDVSAQWILVFRSGPASHEQVDNWLNLQRNDWL